MSVTYLGKNIVEFEIVFTDPDNDDIPVDPQAVTFEFLFACAVGAPFVQQVSMITYTGSSTPAVNTIFRILNDDNVYCYRCRIDTTAVNALIIGTYPAYGTGQGRWVSTGTGAAAANDYINIEKN